MGVKRSVGNLKSGIRKTCAVVPCDPIPEQVLGPTELLIRELAVRGPEAGAVLDLHARLRAAPIQRDILFKSDKWKIASA